jgi:nucleotide-binding universal stress UspA family protein
MRMTSTRPRPFTNILCPIDFSDPSRAALQVAKDLADDPGVHLTVLYVHDPTVAGAEAIVLSNRSLSDIRREIREFATKVLTPALARAGTTTYVAAVGRPAQEILKVAKRRHCDVIVMGSRGLGGIRKLLLGSTTDHVVHHASIPVLAIRWGKPTKRRAHKDLSLRFAG